LPHPSTRNAGLSRARATLPVTPIPWPP
jgi:hypothetical protein